MKLTGNEIALAQEAAGLAIAWYKKQANKRSKWVRDRIAAQQRLIKKLSTINDHAYPYERFSEEDSLPCHGDEPILTIDAKAVKSTRAAAEKWNALNR